MRAALLLGVLVLAGCMQPTPPPPDGPPVSPPDTEAGILEAARAFAGAVAFGHAQVQLYDGSCQQLGNCTGPARYRIPGTEGNNATARDLADALRGAGFDTRLDRFTATFEGRPVPAHNVVAERPGRTNTTLYLGAHYDSRPCADKDPDPAKRDQPVLGANDGASGVAVLLHLAELLEGRAMNLTLRVVFFDAEDMGDAGTGCGVGTSWAQGSAHYVDTLTDAEVARARGFVLLDIVGDTDLELRREGRSAVGAHRALQDDLWAWAARLGHAQFLDATAPAIVDDHVPFQARGIPSVDVIHLDDDGRDLFPDTHHTTFDDLEHVSAASLEAVGETVLAAVLAWDAAEGARPSGLM